MGKRGGGGIGAGLNNSFFQDKCSTFYMLLHLSLKQKNFKNSDSKQHNKQTKFYIQVDKFKNVQVHQTSNIPGGISINSFLQTKDKIT